MRYCRKVLNEEKYIKFSLMPFGSMDPELLKFKVNILSKINYKNVV